MWIGENEVQQGIVKVKSLSKKEEYEIKREDLVDRVRELVEANPVLLPQDLQAKEEEKKTE